MKKKISTNVSELMPKQSDKFAPVDTKASTNPWMTSRLKITLVCIIVHETRELWNQNIVFADCFENRTSLQSFKHEQSKAPTASIMAESDGNFIA
jgi:hypothetical protein